MAGVIAIVGRPNVGKSALFNRIVGRRIAIVHDEPGVTRDRISAEAEWKGRKFTLVDTGGIGLMQGEKSADVIVQAALDQVRIAIEAADSIILVVNVRDGVAALDRDAAQLLRRSGKAVSIAVNKADHSGVDSGADEFSELGFNLFPVSAIHGRGIEDLLGAATRSLPDEAVPADEESGDEGDESEKVDEPLKIAILGRPNVGKSSLINALTRSDRVIVSPTPGTTRDAVDVPFEVLTEGKSERYVLIDTAGIRRSRRIDNSIEFFSVKRAEDSVSRCDLAIFVLDAQEGVKAHDKKIAGKILEHGKGCVLVVNKWDLVEEGLKEARKEARLEGRADGPEIGSLADFAKWVQEQLFFLDYAPVIFTSAKSGFHLDQLLEAVRFVTGQLRQNVPTALLNRALHDAIEERQPVSAMGHRMKFFYATQLKKTPPTFLLFVNRDELFSDTYQRYLKGVLRRAFGFEGCPLVLVARARPKTIESKRKAKPKQTAPRKSARANPTGRQRAGARTKGAGRGHSRSARR